VDEALPTIDGERHDLWLAADQDGHVPDIPVQRRPDKQAAKTFFRDPLKGLPYGSRVIITDQLKRHGAALLGLLPGAERRNHRRKTPTDRHASGSGGCGGSSRPGTPGASSPRLGPLRRISGPGAAPALLEHTASGCPRDSKGAPSKMSALIMLIMQEKPPAYEPPLPISPFGSSATAWPGA